MSDDKENPIAVAPAQNSLAMVLADPERLQAIPVETVERLFELDQRMRAEEARKAFYAAMNAVQGEMRPVRRLGENAHTRSKYAYLEAIQRMLNPILNAHGFSTSASTVEPIVPDTMRICLTIRHVGGHVEHHYMDAEIDDTGPGGKKMKTRLHGAGSTFTYCERMLTAKVFGVVLTDNVDDDDGNRLGELEEFITPEQAADLRALAEEVEASVPRLLVYLRVPNLESLPASQYKLAVTALEAKRRAD